MWIRIHDLAIEEIAREIEYYELRAVGLGAALLAEIRAAIALIDAFPRIGAFDRKRRPERRIAPLDRFPFTLPYEIGVEEIVVLALAHRRRKPGYWRIRLA
ncbi:MAG TPA: type II toxin-antitoxin system RelE/ParE family toxin [Kofleriaceae bacterium]|jgi:plasmid stabilization system protein ParE